MPCAPHEALHVHAGIPERRERFGASAGEGVGDVLGPRHDADSAPAPAGNGFDHHRAAVAERRQERRRTVQIDFLVAAGEHRYVQRACERACPSLVAEELEHVGPRSGERQPGIDAPLRERGVLAQKTVARMDGVARRGAGCGEHCIRVEVGRGPRPGQRHRFIRDAHVQRRRIVAGKRRHAHDTERRGSACDADRDLAAVRDEQSGHAHLAQCCMGIASPSGAPKEVSDRLP